jgi:cytochrome c peroxidase
MFNLFKQNSLGIIILLVILYSTTSSTPKQNAKLVKLGALLFADNNLSINKSKSCLSCHHPELYFTDGYRRAIGAYGDVLMHNTPSILNSASYKYLNWRTPHITNLIQQMQQPLFAKNHIELGMDLSNNASAVQILSNPIYKKALGNNAKSWQTIMQAISAFVHTLSSTNSKYDAFLNNKAKLTMQEETGRQLFFSDSLGCYKCHGGKHLNTPINKTNYYCNTGVQADTLSYRIPSLRNVAATAPYYHNGSAANLTTVITNYSKGGIATANKHKLITGFTITDAEVKCLIAFLQTFTDTTVLNKYSYLQ